MSDKVMKQFGRYFLLDKIAKGGMADIFRARLIGQEGSARVVILKKTHLEKAREKGFVEMFRNEMRVSMSLNHPNIAQIFDYGTDDGVPFMVMEYVMGFSLQQLRRRASELNIPIAPEVVLYIIAQAAKGLQYAHVVTDPMTGKQMGVVHRDISPQNVLISLDAVIKVIDFGIAKASSNTNQTMVGIVKGKPRYMSPEQVLNSPLDGRSDVFSLGIVLWELLTGKRLFGANETNEYLIMRQVEAVEKHLEPASTLNPLVTPEVDAIVQKALEKDRNLRFSSAQDFADTISLYLRGHGGAEHFEKELRILIPKLFGDWAEKSRLQVSELMQEAEYELSNLGLDRTLSLQIPGEAKTVEAADPTIQLPSMTKVDSVALPGSTGIRLSSLTTSIQVSQSSGSLNGARTGTSNGTLNGTLNGSMSSTHQYKRSAIEQYALIAVISFVLLGAILYPRIKEWTGMDAGERAPAIATTPTQVKEDTRSSSGYPGEPVAGGTASASELPFFSMDGKALAKFSISNQLNPVSRPALFETNDQIMVLKFDGINDWVDMGSITQKVKGLNALQLFFVARTTEDRVGYIFSCQDESGQNDRDFMRFGFAGKNRLRLFGTQKSPTDAPTLMSKTAQFQVYSVLYTKFLRTIRVNGLPVTTMSESIPLEFADINQCSLGQEFDRQGPNKIVPSDFFAGELAEVLMFDGELKPSDLEAVEKKLITKYRIFVPAL